MLHRQHGGQALSGLDLIANGINKSKFALLQV
jgi:hypothetical protein